MKKLISILLVITLLCSTFAGLHVTASADWYDDDYWYDDDDDYWYDDDDDYWYDDDDDWYDDDDDWYDDEGRCGTDVYYSLNRSTGTMTISGSGEMTDYDWGDSPFFENTAIKSVVIQSGVTSVGEFAFADCEMIKSVTIANSVTSIGEFAFRGCIALTSVAIPNSVTSIGDYAFFDCNKLTAITVAAGNPKYDSRNNCNAIIETATNTLITGCKNTVIPDSVTGIGNGAFKNCSGLTIATIPHFVTSIGEDAFYGCDSLTTITISDSVTNIGAGAFAACNVTSITVAAGNPKYDSRNNCNAIIETATNALIVGCNNTVIPDSVTSIGDRAFSGCEKIKTITIGNSVTSIGNEAFYCCSELKNVTIGNSVTSIGKYAFLYCDNLTIITIPASLKSIGEGVFTYDDLSEEYGSLEIVRYCGTKAQWSLIEIGEDNYSLDEATIYFNYNPNHQHSYTASKQVAATTTALGYTTYTCKYCGDAYQKAFKAPTGKLTLKRAGRNAGAVKVQWNKVNSASGYQVQISTKDGKKWSTYANLKAGVTTYTFSKLAAGNNYKFRVRFYIKAADGKNYYSPWSATLNSPTLPAGTSLSKLTGAKKAFTAQWKKQANATGYQVQYSTKSNFSGAKTLTVKSNKILKNTFKKLGAKKVYYVRIRTYKTISKVNYYSAWSKAVKVKTK